MKFVKMHGAGNDFVVVDGLAEDLESLDLVELSRRMCDRHFGIGSDGLILVLPSRTAAFRMRMFNPDGSEAEMCGNGIRCFAKYVYDRGLTLDTSFTVETLAGVKELRLSVEDRRVVRVRVDMGSPSFDPEAVPVKAQAGPDGVARVQLRVGGRRLEGTCLSMGNPHCVVLVEDIAAFPVEKIGPLIEDHRLFPRRTNVPFVQVLARDHLKVRVWERGAGETLACGTGACAAAVACALNGVSGRRAAVELPGGRLEIEWRGDNRVLLDGPAAEVFTGEFPV